jgi:hypothetical protein
MIKTKLIIKHRSIGLLALLVAFLATSCSLLAPSPFNRQAFDSQAWKAYGSAADNRRYEMLDDLMARHLPASSVRGDIEAQLGLADTVRNDGDATVLEYNCGMPASNYTIIDPEILTLRFRDDRLIAKSHAES